MIKFNKYNTNVFNFLIEKNKVILPKKNDNEINNIYQYIFYAIHNSVNLVNNSKLFYNKIQMRHLLILHKFHNMFHLLKTNF